MKYKKEIFDKTKRLILYSERMALDKPDYSEVDKFVDKIRVLELCNELKVLLNQPYRIIKSMWRQPDLNFGNE